MAKRKERSVFWVVSTHVLTTGFAMPLLAYLAVFGIAANVPLDAVQMAGLMFAMLTLGYVGGVYYSLSYLRKAAIIPRPLACITPSIITFAIFSAIGFALNIVRMRDPLVIAGMAAYYVAITVVFAFVTRRGFQNMVVEPRGFPVQQAPKAVVELSKPES